MPSSDLIRDLRGTTVPTADEERELLRRVKRARAKVDRQAARDELVLRNMPMVFGIAGKYTGNGVPYDDLVQEGVLGLLRGIDRFRIETGHRLSTLAWFWVRQSVQRRVATHHKVCRMPYAWSQVNQRGQFCEESRRNLEMLTSTAPLELDGGDGNAHDLLVSDDQPADAGVIAAEEREELDRVLGRLSARERDVLWRRAEGETLASIAGGYGLSRERIRQIEGRAMEKVGGIADF